MLFGSMSYCPPAGDTLFWAQECEPLLELLEGGKQSWPALNIWARAHRLTTKDLRNRLAWLEIERLADGDASGWWRLADPYKKVIEGCYVEPVA